MDLAYPLIPIANFLACILVLASLSRSMFQSWNVGVCSFAIWVLVTGFTTAVNSIVWARNVKDVAPVWCDIVTRLGIASEAGIPAASFVIVRRLSIMMRHRNPILATRRKLNLLVDLSLCLGTPAIHIALYYVAQANRFEIIEEVGCLNATGTSVLAVLLVNIIPITFPVLSLTLYSPRLVWLYFKRGELGEILASSSHLDRRSFIKVLALGLFDIFITLPLTVYDLVQNFLPGGITTFWPGWKTAHSEISSVPTITSDEWKSAGPVVVSSIVVNEWINPLFAIIFFTLFGLTANNRLWYRNLFWKIIKPLGIAPRLQPVAPSDIVFVSVPEPIDSNESHPEIKFNQLSAPVTTLRGKFFDNVADIEEGRSDSSGSQSKFTLEHE